MKITKSQLKAIIKEEALKFKRAVELKKELAEIEKQLNEVKAGAVMEPGTGGVHAGQKKAVFASKGNPNLKMEDGIEGDEAPVDMDVDVTAEVPTEVPTEGSGETMSKDEVRSAIHDLEVRLGLNGGAPAGEVGAEVGADVPSEDVPGDEGEEEFEFDTEEPSDESGVETEKPEEEEVTMEAKPAEKKEEGVKMEEEKTVAENLDEPIEGESPIQDAKENKIGVPFVEKAKNVKEGAEEKAETIAEAEKKRMAFLAGILKG